MQVKTLNANQAAELIASKNCQLVDVRDPASFQQASIKNALHLDNSSLANFLATTDKENPVIVYCYSGFASQNVALYLEGQGYKEVYSLNGGFNTWQASQPHLCS